jgi:transcriptional regulator with XRE-family HTH domain
MKPLHIRLREKRKKRGLTQVQAAKELGVCSDTLSRWERGVKGFHPLRVPAVEKWIAGR